MEQEIEERIGKENSPKTKHEQDEEKHSPSPFFEICIHTFSMSSSNSFCPSFFDFCSLFLN